MEMAKPLFCILLTTLFCTAGCVTGRSPLQGWKGGKSAIEGCPFDKLLCDDYRRYIDNLSAEERVSVDDFSIHFYEDGRRLRAVEITTRLTVRSRTHVLIYDANSKRIRTSKYTSNWYVF
jgi:hypothetical protein